MQECGRGLVPLRYGADRIHFTLPEPVFKETTSALSTALPRALRVERAKIRETAIPDV